MPKTLLPQDDGAFEWRGVMMDAARHFQPPAVVKRLIDGMAVLKLNVLHLHLSDDQGWRFESKKWPKLTSVGGQRSETVIGKPGQDEGDNLHPENYTLKYDGKPHGGFYTQDELRDIAKHAKSKGVTIVPEIDMPGHMRAARAAYPELGYDGVQPAVGRSWGIYREILRADDKGIQFAKDILGEICDVFEDSPYVHIGGDEAPKAEWVDAPSAGKQVKEIGGNPDSVADYDKLQQWFTQQLGDFLASRGRKLVGWDEILDGGELPRKDCMVMCWRTDTNALGRAAKMGANMVNSASTLYFDYTQGNLDDEPLCIGKGATLAEVYSFDPYEGVTDEQKPQVHGLQAQLWSEYIPTEEHLWYMMFPRLIAMADIGYYGDKRKPYAEFLKELPDRLAELEKLGIGHRPLGKK